ncbi:hypothetical protein PHLCEN_2v2528, partial [Hermanssonia centrifuga]
AAGNAVRIWRPSLQLGGITIYMLNALTFRPGDQSWDRELVNKSAVWAGEEGLVENSDDELEADEDFENDRAEPFIEERGLYFVSDIVYDSGAFRLPQKRTLSIEELCAVYNTASWGELQGKFNMSTFHRGRASDVRRPMRMARRVRTTDARFVRTDSPGPEVDLGLGNRGVRMHEPATMTGPDVIEISDSEDEEKDIDKVVSKILKQFPYDVIQQSPNQSANNRPAYTTLTRVEQDNVTMDIFKQTELPFIRAQLKIVSTHTWDRVFFDRFFPPKGFSPRGRIQNFPSCAYYQDWIGLINRMTSADVEIARKKIAKYFKDVHWLPHTASDRMWMTKLDNHGQWTHLPGAQVASPQIALNPYKYVTSSCFTLRTGEDEIEILD